jgi:phosphopantothenoylcysteine decarboxylase / phosphopantothenate---cysteine ligase
LKVLLGVTGGIAAYRAGDIIRGLKKKGADVTCVMSGAAKEFITPLTLRALSGNPVYDDLFFEAKNPGAPVTHIDLARNCDALLIAPATANIIGKIAGGIADDLLTTVVMATEKKVVIAPAMNSQMWKNPIVRENVKKLEKLGYFFIGPKEGDLACGEYGEGHIEDTEKIIDKTLSCVKKKS